jgi:cytosine/adenosine deaminase-related metal-dependent hydrolase
MLLRTGCTTVADIEALPELLPSVWNATPLKVYSFLEMIGITARRSPEVVLGEVTRKLDEFAARDCLVGLSPHAPYSTVPELLRQTATLSRRRGLRICHHLAESRTEFEMFAEAKGEMFRWMRQSGRDMSDCGAGSPVHHAARNGLLGERLLAVHVNYLARGDAGMLGRAQAHVVHCPRSHEYFAHARFPLERLRRARVNVCLGTDSLASVLKRRKDRVELNMFDEMQALLRAHPGVSPRTALQMSTVAGAKALGLEGKLGQLSPGATADLIAIPADTDKKLFEAVVHYRGEVTASMINGAWAIPPNLGSGEMDT